MVQEVSQGRDGAALAVSHIREDLISWRARWSVHKYAEDAESWLAGNPGKTIDDFQATHTPIEVIEREGNILTYGGISNLWQCLIGNGTATAAQTLTFFNNGNAHIGVGDSTTAAAATQTDLQAATNKLRKAMDATYPTHSDGTGSGAAVITFKSTFGTSDANFAWEEWGIFNGSSGGRMLNRKVEALGTKSSGTWVLTVTVTLS